MLNLSQRVTHMCVIEDLNITLHYCLCNDEETLLQDFLVILKRILKEMFPRYFIIVSRS